MSDKFTFIAMLQITTHDPRLSEAAIAEVLNSRSARSFSKVRRAVLQHLPGNVTRMVAVMPVEHAQMLMMLHEAHGEAIAKALAQAGITSDADDGTIFVR